MIPPVEDLVAKVRATAPHFTLVTDSPDPGSSAAWLLLFEVNGVERAAATYDPQDGKWGVSRVPAEDLGDGPDATYTDTKEAAAAVVRNLLPPIETWEDAANELLGMFGKRFRSIDVNDTEALKNINPGKDDATIVGDNGSQEARPLFFYMAMKQLIHGSVNTTFWSVMLPQWLEMVKNCADCKGLDDLCPVHSPKMVNS